MLARSLLVALLLVSEAVHAQQLGIGTRPDPALLRAWDIDIAPDGAGLPPGSGDVAAGKRVYAQRCAACHGSDGQGGPMDRLVGGRGSLASAKPVKTIGSYWPYATTLFDYVRRAMPFNAPQTLSNDEVYAVTAYLLRLNGIVADDATLDAATLAAVRMPNRDGFVPDPRPDVR
jgi:S-disulfanyl-L-cysteine oxidoreductase SoxD